ncbi:MAG: cytochrome c [Proteobacteria bacterium]|nr:cytochrome c [Pseudomonadota bacterium]
MGGRRILGWIVLLGVVLAVGAFAWAGRYGELEAIAPPDQNSFDRQLVERGRELTAIGDCEVCHTGLAGIPFAGGLALPTPFGTIYTTNITPDPDAGIGAWSEEAFRRAMHEGVDREGRYLYPAFPYDRFTLTTDEDIAAIYAYIMSDVPASDLVPPENELGFPFNIRLSLAGWNLLFLKNERFQPDPNQDEEWNRGAYLVEGLGHCGSCHSPRNLMGAEVNHYDGGFAEGWLAPALNENSTAPIRWSRDALVNYLYDGWDRDHGVTAGPMTPIVNHLYDRSEDNVYPMAAYVAWLGGTPVPTSDEAREAAADRIAFANEVEWDEANPPEPADEDLARGAVVYRDLCAKCHKQGADIVPLALTSTVNFPDPANILRVVRDGVRPPRGAMNRSMPAFGPSLTDENLVDVLRFLRDRYTDKPAWTDLDKAVAEARAELH